MTLHNFKKRHVIFKCRTGGNKQPCFRKINLFKNSIINGISKHKYIPAFPECMNNLRIKINHKKVFFFKMHSDTLTSPSKSYNDNRFGDIPGKTKLPNRYPPFKNGKKSSAGTVKVIGVYDSIRRKGYGNNTDRCNKRNNRIADEYKQRKNHNGQDNS